MNIDIYKMCHYFSREYLSTGEPIQINFRNLVPELNNNERYSHLIHSYPAKLLSNIPYFFLQSITSALQTD